MRTAVIAGGECFRRALLWACPGGGRRNSFAHGSWWSEHHWRLRPVQLSLNWSGSPLGLLCGLFFSARPGVDYNSIFSGSLLYLLRCLAPCSRTKQLQIFLPGLRRLLVLGSKRRR